MRATTYFLNMLFVILSSSAALARTYFVHIINYFSCFIKQWSHKIHLQNLTMSLLLPTILREVGHHDELLLKLLVALGFSFTRSGRYTQLTWIQFTWQFFVQTSNTKFHWNYSVVSDTQPESQYYEYILYTVHIILQQMIPPRTSRLQNLIVQLTSEDIWGSALVKRESQNLMCSVQHQDLSSMQQEVMQKQRMWFWVNNPGTYTNAMM